MAQKSKQQNNNQDQAALEIEAQKRELMKAETSMKLMKNRMDRMELEKNTIDAENQGMKDKLSSEKSGLVELIEFHKKEKEELREEKQRIEFEYNILKRKMDDIDEHYTKLLELKAKDFDMERMGLLDKIKQLEAKLEKIESFLQVKADLENEKKSLLENLQKEKADKQRELADKDREKQLETDKLKKEMLHKIQDTKQQLLALKKEQLETTTRLTVLQNHQLTTELEYQSKQTEKLLFKNSKLTEQVTSLNRDIEIHKQVEQELAKRSHFSQKLIKKLSSRIKELEEELERKQELEQQDLQDTERKEFDEKNKEIEQQIIQYERKLAKLQNDNDILRNENNYLQTKIYQLKQEDNKYTNLSLILANNLEQLKQQSTFDENEIKEVDLQELREKNVNEWSVQQKTAILNILLTQAQQMITKRNISSMENENITVIDNAGITDTNYPNKSVNLPKIHQDDESQQGSRRFQGVPLEISTQIVKSKIRDWGKPSMSQPQGHLARKIRVHK